MNEQEISKSVYGKLMNCFCNIATNYQNSNKVSYTCEKCGRKYLIENTYLYMKYLIEVNSKNIKHYNKPMWERPGVIEIYD